MEIEDAFRKLRPILGKEKLEPLWIEYLLYPEHRKEIEGIVNALKEKHLGEGFEKNKLLLVPPVKEIAQGEYALGTVYYGENPYYPFGLRENEWIQHMGIFGRTGSGKTNVGFLIVKNLLEKNKPFLIFDWKRNYRDLIGYVNKDILIFTVGRDVSQFCFNPLIPPEGTLLTVWIKKIIEIMCHAYYLGEGVAFLLQKAMDDVFNHAGNPEGDRAFPTLSDVKAWLENHKTKGREAQWMDSALRVLGTLCYGEVGNVLNAKNPFSIKDILDKNVVFELDALTDADKIFFIESLILWIHHFRLQEQTREKFKHAIIIEEAHHILLRKKQSKESIMDVIVREIRELGESLILLDQHPCLISIPALGNTNCTIAMSLKHRLDVNSIAYAMLIEEEQKEYLGMLEIGWGIVRMQNRLSKPFLAKFPLFEIKKGMITDADVRAKMAGFSGDSPNILPEEKKIEDIRRIREKDKIRKNEITEEEKKLLIDVMEYPISGIAERYKRLSFSVYKGNRIRDTLISKELLNSYSLSTFEGRVNYLDLTEMGEKALREMGYKIEKKREGGPEHEYWKHRIAKHLKKKGYEIEIESPIGEGKTVDIVAYKGEEKIAVEIETGKSDVIENFLKNIDESFSKIIFIPLTKMAEKELQIYTFQIDRMKKLNRIQIITLKEILKSQY
jgi:Holliday junction resolvase-like predicted endonuclease